MSPAGMSQSRRKVVDDVSFQIRRGEILGIAGLVGAGRTELVSTLFGAYAGSHKGSVHLDGREITIRSPRDAVQGRDLHGAEDRKRSGILPIIGVGHNMTISVLNRFAAFGLSTSMRNLPRSRRKSCV